MKHPIIFVELHHAGLYQSLQMLVEDRLEGTLIRPIGAEWFERGLWHNAEIYANHPDTIKQYLEIRHTVPTKMGPRNNVVGEEEEMYLVENPFKAEHAVTYDQFMRNKPDIIMCSYIGNLESYSKLAKELGIPLILQMGNVWAVPWHLVDNVMASTGKFPIPPNKQVIFYHQEIDLKTFYKGDYAFNSQLLTSFVNCLAEHDIHRQSWEDFQALEKLMPDYTFKSYGIENRDGTITEQTKVADIMRQSKFGIHLKGGGDGFGHTLFDWFALGKPVIFRGSQYRDKLAEAHLIHGVTGFDLDQITLEALKDKLIGISEEEYKKMSDNVYRIFQEKCDFDKEFIEIKKFLNNLI